jgi:hypothetical protein
MVCLRDDHELSRGSSGPTLGEENVMRLTLPLTPTLTPTLNLTQLRLSCRSGGLGGLANTPSSRGHTCLILLCIILFLSYYIWSNFIIYIFMYIYMYMYIYVCIYIYIYFYMYIYMHMYVYICICMYIYI